MREGKAGCAYILPTWVGKEQKSTWIQTKEWMMIMQWVDDKVFVIVSTIDADEQVNWF